MTDDEALSSNPAVGTTRSIADHLRQTGRYAEASGLYRHLLRNEAATPALVEAYVACLKLSHADPVAALSLLLDHRPEDTVLRAALVELCQSAADHERVLHLVRTGGDDLPLPLLLAGADAAFRLGELRQSADFYRAAIERDPSSTAARTGLARIGARHRQYDRVLDSLDDDRDTMPDKDPARVGLRIAANRRLGQLAQAAQAASDGIDRMLDARDIGNAARLMERQGFFDVAQRMRRRVGSDQPLERRRILRRIGSHLLIDGHVSEAIRVFRQLDARDWRRRVPAQHMARLQALSRALGLDEMPGLDGLAAMDIELPDVVLERLAGRAAVRVRPPESPRKALLVTGTLGPGGAERQLVLTAMGLAERSTSPDRIHVASLQDLSVTGNDHHLAELHAAGITCHDLALGRDHPDARLPVELSHAANLVGLLPDNLAAQLGALCRLMVAERPAVVHGWQDVTGAIVALAGLLAGVPQIVIGTRSLAPDRKEGRNRPYLRRLMLLLLAHQRVSLVNNSQSGRDDYSRWLGMAPADIGLVRNGFDLAGFPVADRASPAAERAVVIGGVMRLTEEKRPMLWLETVLELRRRGFDVRGVLVGDGPFSTPLARRIAEAGLEDRIELAGRRTAMAREYAGMDVLLLTSRTEGFPNVLVEAQATGCPVVATDAGGARETFLDGKTGFLVREATPAALADVLVPLVEDHMLRARFGRRAADHVRSAFGWSAMLDRTEQAYGWDRRDEEHAT
ncbi:glycosyltransferase [Minwuia sp.]|uniref:glycosyltransferase n=1 Tax=Minwuia sp. TaxID=2493630 RepID=UPI003A90A4CE